MCISDGHGDDYDGPSCGRIPCGVRGVPCVRNASCVPCRGDGDVPSCGAPSCRSGYGAWRPGEDAHVIRYKGIHLDKSKMTTRAVMQCILKLND